MISIITPVLNGEKFILDNLQSICKLNINYEHIVVDGGSTDKTLEIVKKFQKVKVVHQADKTGMYGGIHLGFREAKGEFICWVNCDDVIIPQGFERMCKYAQNKNIDFICSDGIIKWINGRKEKKIKGTRLVKYFLKNGIFPFLQPTTVYKKTLYMAVNGLDYNRYKVVGDMDLFYRMSKVKNAKFGYIPINTSIFLKHPDSLGDNNAKLGRSERKKNSVLPKPSRLNKYFLRLVRAINF